MQKKRLFPVITLFFIVFISIFSINTKAEAQGTTSCPYCRVLYVGEVSNTFPDTWTSLGLEVDTEYLVDETTPSTADYSGYDMVWYNVLFGYDNSSPTVVERLTNVLNDDRGVYLANELDTTYGDNPLNLTNSWTGLGINHILSEYFPRTIPINSSIIGDISSYPNLITDFELDGFKGFLNIPDVNRIGTWGLFSNTYVGFAFEGSNLNSGGANGNGRLASINDSDVFNTSGGVNPNLDLNHNIAFFLSGLDNDQCANSPIAVDDSGSVTINQSVNVDVLNNDTDGDIVSTFRITAIEGDYIAEGDTTTLPDGTQVTLLANQTLDIAPSAGSTTPISFEYTVKDGCCNAATANVNLIVTNSVGGTSTIPATGFPQDGPTFLSSIDEESRVAYQATNIYLEIPSLDVEMKVVGIPTEKDTWDVKWLGDDAGYLTGTAFPTTEGNTIITGHVWNLFNSQGPFFNLKKLIFGDKVMIEAWGKSYVYEVRENYLVDKTDSEIFTQEKVRDWLTLITCENYNETNRDYNNRRIVQAVLTEIIE